MKNLNSIAFASAVLKKMLIIELSKKGTSPKHIAIITGTDSEQINSILKDSKVKGKKS
jgi:hypothetical protein